MKLDALSGRSGVAQTRNGGSLLARRTFLVVLLASLAVLVVAGCSGGEAGGSAREETEPTTRSGTSQEEGAAVDSDERPNMVFVLTDDLDYEAVQQMPGIGSSLVEGGISFEETFVSHPVCCPSRATILTGLYDHNHQVLSNNPPSGGFEKFRDEGHEEGSIAVGLQEGGYRTAFFGKYLNGYPADDDTHVPPGWDEWYGKLDGQRLYDYGMNENGEIVSYGSATEDFFTDVLSGQATDFVRRAAPEEQPFFAYVAPTAPHGPATPAERHEGAFADEEPPRPPSFNEEDVSDKPPHVRDSEPLTDEEVSGIDEQHRQRLESLLAVDEMVTSLVEELEAAGELDNTYIFFTSDNGWEGGEHRIPKGKNRPYEESAHVPLLVRGPGVTAGTASEKLTLNTDLAPTFADLAGAEFPSDGRSLAPLLHGEDPSWRSAILLERLPAEGGEDEGEGEGKGKGKGKNKGKSKNKDKAGGGAPPYQAIRTGEAKYVEYESGDGELYDLEADPYELENIYGTADPSLIGELESRLEALRDCSGDGCREAEDAR